MSFHCWDVASYEAALRSRDLNCDPGERKVSNIRWDELRLELPTVLPPTDTLRDVETWIAAQSARARAYELALAELQTAHADTQARADTLVLELEIAQKSLQTTLSRANDTERAAQERDAAVQAAESCTARLQTELEETRRELADVAKRLAIACVELDRSRESQAGTARDHERTQQREEELREALDGRSNQVSQFECELGKLRISFAASEQELAQRSEAIALIQNAHASQQVVSDNLAREREALAARVAVLTENLQSNEWKREVWERAVHDLEANLANARALIEKYVTERADTAGSTEKLRTELEARDAAITRLEKEHAVQLTTLEELGAVRAREQLSYVAGAQESRNHAEVLDSEIKALTEKLRDSIELVAVRESERDESRSAYALLEQAMQSLQSDTLGQAARISEVESLATNLGQALQAQTETTAHAIGSLEAQTRELTSERARIATLEGQLQAALRQAMDQSVATQSAETESAKQLEELTASRERLVAFERAATHQSERVADMQGELSRAHGLAERAEAARAALEGELQCIRDELQRELERRSVLDASQQKLTLEMERMRGALGERDLQLRRLERYATSSAHVLSRIKVGMERDQGAPILALRQVAEYDATLVPLDDSDASPLKLGRQTTIGRAPENDLRLADSSVSRRHAVVTVGPKGAFIEDVRSINGVTVNRQRIRHARLADGDVVELGLKRFMFTTSLGANADAG